MDNSRRDFLRLAGLSLAGAGCAVPTVTALGRALTTAADPERLHARRWAMVVDTRRCASKDGCTACIRACHAGHNVPDISGPQHTIKWTWKQRYGDVFPEQVTPYGDAALWERPVLLACNHCDNPPCVRVCPTQATWRRADGLVMMDSHRCIGCRYCLVACPYGARSFNWQDPRPFIASLNRQYVTRTKGVVEKCTFCAERLAVGREPLCVEACRAEGIGALTFGDAEDRGSEVAALLRANVTTRRRPSLGTGPNIHYIV